MINFIVRYLVPYSWRWNKHLEDRYELSRRTCRDRAKGWVVYDSHGIVDWEKYVKEQIKLSREYWRV